MKKSLFLLFTLFMLSSAVFAQRGRIIRAATTSVMDPNQDGFVSRTTAGFSNDGYYVDEFEITMFGLPAAGGDATGDNIGNACGITDLIPDTKGFSSYAVKEGNNLIFRFRVGDDNPSVESWTVLLDTDGLFGSADPNSNATNPGFEVDITFIKRNNAGVFVYNIDGASGCPQPTLSYDIDSHFQISIADEVSCGDPDYFYDYYVPWDQISAAYGLATNSGLRFVAVTNVSATCAMSGNIADVAGVDNSLPQYANCVTCAFSALVDNQCPTALDDLCQTCGGFEKDKVNKPTIDTPVRAGQTIISGTSDPNIFIKVEIFSRVGGTDALPVWSTTPRETKGNYAIGTVWADTLSGPLQSFDKIIAQAQKTATSVPCGTAGGNQASASVTVVQPNTAPTANSQSLSITEDTATPITLTGSDAENDPLIFTIVTPPAHGVLSGLGATVLYTPSANYNGPDSFTFQVSDGIFSAATPGTVSITVTPVNDAPIAVAQVVTTPEDTPKAITLTSTDVDGGAPTYSIVSGPTHGTLSGTGANLTYTPAANYNGGDSFTFKANDGLVDSNIATITITVSPVPDAPVANPQSVTTLEDQSKAIVLTATDVDGDALTFIIVANPAHGTLSGSGANYTYTPAANYNGADSFTFKANDGTLDSNVATVSITVTPVNDAPIANNQTLTTPEDTALPITLTATDVDGNTLTYSIVASPTHGTLTGSGSSYTYTPAVNYNGPDNFTFKVNDGTVDSNTATISITVTPVNDAPVANALVVTTLEDQSKAITLTASDIDGNPLTFIIVASPAHGTLSGSGANVTYTPASNYNGSDSFTFKANDGTTDSNVATVSITVTPVNDAPIANGQTLSTPEDTALPITLVGTDVDGNTLTYTIVTPPSHGALTGAGSSVTYTPAANYNGPDNFTFKVNDGTVDSNVATISISVTPVNDAPVANAQVVTTPEDQSKAIVLTASDVDGNALTFIIVANPAHGTLSGSGANVTYTPTADFNGPDNFTFKANDGTTDSNIATVSITVTAVNDAPIANNQTLSTPEDTALPITLVGTDVDVDALTYTIVTPPTHGALTGSGASITYTPAANYNGPDAFTFKVNDGTVDSNVATISITVNSVNDAPVANAQVVSTQEDQSKAIVLTASDVDGNALTFIIVANPAHGTLSGSGANVTYTPVANYNGSDSFTFKANDGTTDSNVATVSITVNAVNDAPIANNQTLSTPEDTALPITLVGTDVDVDALTYIIVSSPSHGTLTGSGSSITYTPASNYNGPDNFTFKVNDGLVDSNTAMISITVNSVNDAPVASDQTVSTPEDVAKAITVSATDVEGSSLTYIVVANPTHGTLTGSGPSFTYTPVLNYNGPDNFTFKANDGSVDSNVATVSITVTPVNDAPIADNQSLAYVFNTAKAVTLTGSDVEGSTLTFIVVSNPTNGVLTGTAPNLTYTPNSGFTGTDQFTFKVNDGTTDSNVATVSLFLQPGSNVPPTAIHQDISLAEDTPTAIVLTATDPNGDALTFSIVGSPTHGTLSGSGANVTYTPDANYNGTDSFTFKANDGTADSNTQTISLTITPVNDAPVASDQSPTTAEDTALPITLVATDVDGNTLTYIIVSGPTHGGLSGSGANVTYTPAANYNGPDNFTFKANDGSVDSNIATVSITVTPVNDAPVANAQSVSTLEDQPKAIVLTGSDADGGALTFIIVASPAHGTLTGSGANVTYTPVANFNGSDSFTFKANDGTVDSNVATVSITVTAVNDAPVANSQTISTPEDTALPINLIGTDVDGNTLTYAIVASPAHGTLTGTGSSITYTPAANFNGTDNFTFTVDDGLLTSNVATVSITVTPVNDAPVAANVNATLLEDATATVKLFGLDADGDALTFIVVTSPLHGTLTGTGQFRTYKPAANYNGGDSFTFKVNDGTVDSNTGTVTLTITPVNDAPIAGSQSLSTLEDTALPITLAGTDVDGDVLTYNIIAPPAHGNLTGTGSSITYTPASDYNGTDNFTFSVNDGTVSSNVATISIAVTAVNDAPVAANQNVNTDEDVATAITLTGTDVDANTLTFVVVANPSHGTLTGTAPNLTYTPASNYNGPDAFTFKVNDGTVDSGIGTVSITLNSINDAPIADPQNVGTLENIAKAITLTATDVDGDALTYIVVASPTHGSLTGTGANVTYTPNANFSGVDEFTFKANDGTVDSGPATISIVVTNVNIAPVADNQTLSTDEDVTLPITLTATDQDLDALTYSVVSPPSHGTLTGTAPSFIYTPTLNYNGPDVITFKVNDGTVDSNIATISITIVPVNDLPQVQSQAISTLEDTSLPITLVGTDPDGDPLTWTIVTTPQHGTLTGTAPSLTYMPDANYNGSDGFTFVANDGTADSNTGTVSISVTPVPDPPVAFDLSGSATTTPENVPITITIVAEDPDGDPLTYIIVAPPANGSLTGTAPNLVYTPNPGYTGPDDFTFKVNDGTTDSNVATVSITVVPVRHAPVANDQNVTLIEDTPTAITLTATDEDGDVLNYTLLSQVNHGTLTGTAPNLTYTPSANFNGLGQFTFKVDDGSSDSNIATVHITVAPANDAPTLSAIPDLIIPEDSTIQVCLNAVDVDGDPINFILPTNTSGGGAMTRDVAPYDFCYIFKPVANYDGASIWKMSISDPSSAIAITDVKITMTPVNDAPTAVDDAVEVLRHVPFDGNLILNDTDIEGDALTLNTTPVVNPSHGTITLNPDGTFTYTSERTYRGSDSMVYEVCDSGTPSLCSRATLTIDIGDEPFRVYEGVSPNGDGNNDYMRIEGIDYYVDNHVQIFDRYNNLVFEIRGYDNEEKAWRGQSNRGLGNGGLPEGTYFYLIDLGDNSRPRKGFVVLKRN